MAAISTSTIQELVKYVQKEYGRLMSVRLLTHLNKVPYWITQRNLETIRLWSELCIAQTIALLRG